MTKHILRNGDKRDKTNDEVVVILGQHLHDNRMLNFLSLILRSVQLCLGCTCINAFSQYQVISLDTTSQVTQVETCCYVVWGKERNLYQWSTNRGPAAALVKFQNPIAVKNLEIFTAVMRTENKTARLENLYFSIYTSCSFREWLLSQLPWNPVKTTINGPQKFGRIIGWPFQWRGFFLQGTVWPFWKVAKKWL